MPFCHYSGFNLWILKATRLNQGQGIHVCNSLPQTKQLIEKYCTGFPKKESESFMLEKDIKSLQKQRTESDSSKRRVTKKASRGKSDNKIKVSDDDSSERALSHRSTDAIKTPMNELKQIEPINELDSDVEEYNTKSNKKSKKKDKVIVPL